MKKLFLPPIKNKFSVCSLQFVPMGFLCGTICISLLTAMFFSPLLWRGAGGEVHAQYTMLSDFTNGAFTGANPQGDQNLISVGGILYGMTTNGGTNGMGTIFKIMPDGTGYVKLLDFAGASNGRWPYGSLISDGTFLYGVTERGGTNDMGTLFKIMPDGTGYSKLFDFAGASNGKWPFGSLISDGTFLYGTTGEGGANGMGTIFKIMPDGTGYSKLLDFAGAANGSGPRGFLISDGTFLYGMTNGGGSNSSGTVYRIAPDGTGYVKLFDFNGANGAVPQGSLLSDGTFLYGMTWQAGTNGMGTIFKIMPDGTSFSILLDFAGAANGSNPWGSLISDGTFLYGMAMGGGISNLGTIFKIKPDGTGFSKLLDFAAAANGSNPYGSLISDGTFLYGMASQGGTNSNNGGLSFLGTLFKIKPDGTGFAKLLDFAGAANGSYPYGSLISVGTFLYGMTNQGGTNNLGTLFKIMPDGTGYTKLLDFAGAANGRSPRGSLISDGTFLYGMTEQGGTANIGTVFKYQYCTPVTANATANVVCAGTSVTLTGGGASSYTWSGGVTNGVGFVPTSTATYSVTGAGGGACSNTATVQIWVLSNASSQTYTVCAGQSVTVGSNTYTVSGTYQDTLTSVICGNDSIVTTNLTVLPANTFSQSPTVCAGQSISVGSNSYSVSGTYTDVLASLVNGCDSTVTTNLTVLPANTFSQSPTLCAGQSITVGSNTYTVSGTYQDTLTSYQGCDSTVTTNLTVNSVNTAVTASANTLTANAAGASYQWLDCGNGNTPIPSATNQSYTATVNGSYAVIVTQNGCSDTSACYNVTNVGTNEMDISSSIIISPNPTNGEFTVYGLWSRVELSVYNIFGEKVFSKTVNSKPSSAGATEGRQETVNLTVQPKGLYLVKIVSNDETTLRKVIIE